MRTRKAGQGKTYDKEAPGFAHLAWNASSRQEVDSLYELLKSIDAVVLDPPCEMSYSPGYYTVWFQDPDGMKLEYAFTPMQNPTTHSEFKRLKTRNKLEQVVSGNDCYALLYSHRLQSALRRGRREKTICLTCVAHATHYFG